MNYDKIISKKAAEIKPSGIRKFFDMLDDMKDVIALTVGQPDFVTPWHIREVGVESLVKGKTYYTSNKGTLELRREIANYLERRFKLNYCAEDEIIVTVGGSEAIDIAMRSIIDPGDEVIVVEPSFVCYKPIASLCGGVPVVAETYEKDNFKLTAETLRKCITDKTKLLVLPFPSNPTGAIMTEKELREIADVLRGTDIMVLSDEIYAELHYGSEPHVSFANIEGMRERTITVSGFSKAYAMTGWRLGYVCAPKEITNQMFKIHQYAIMCAPTTSQLAAIEALKNGDADVEMMVASYNDRRKLLVKGLRDMGIPCFEPEGAFYVFPNVGVFGLSSEEFATRLLNEAHVAIVPGTAFGDCGEGYARISYAYSVEHITEALKRMREFVEKLK